MSSPFISMEVELVCFGIKYINLRVVGGFIRFGVAFRPGVASFEALAKFIQDCGGTFSAGNSQQLCCSYLMNVPFL